MSDDKLEFLIDQQYECETETSFVPKELFEERNPPSTCHEFYTARMFLCHLGLLSKFRSNNKQVSICVFYVDADNNVEYLFIYSHQNENGSLIALDNSKEGFAQALKNLDAITRRTCDTCHVFYVKTGQKRYPDILENSVIFHPFFFD